MKHQYTILPDDRSWTSSRATQSLDIDYSSAAAALTADAIPFTSRSQPARTAYEIWKRAFDLIVASIGITIALPVLLGVAVAIKLTSHGPVIFAHRRIGLNGEEFDCWKFRTMVPDAEQVLKNDPELQEQFRAKFKIDDDPRVTRVGGFLRRTSLDELPQLFQVMAGRMTLIGPRPIVRREVPLYSVYCNKLFSVKPGLSGLWQTSGRSDTTYAERVLIDVHYIDHRGIGLDMRIFLRTFAVVLKRAGAC